jgi:hypothetical protein
MANNPENDAAPGIRPADDRGEKLVGAAISSKLKSSGAARNRLPREGAEAFASITARAASVRRVRWYIQ